MIVDNTSKLLNELRKQEGIKDEINQILKKLHKNKQITKEVYNMLNKAITYVQSTNV